MSLWQRQCIICRRENRALVYCRRLAPFGIIGLCADCRAAVLDELLAAYDPHSLSEVFALLRWEDAERRAKPSLEGE